MARLQYHILFLLFFIVLDLIIANDLMLEPIPTVTKTIVNRHRNPNNNNDTMLHNPKHGNNQNPRKASGDFTSIRKEHPMHRTKGKHCQFGEAAKRHSHCQYNDTYCGNWQGKEWSPLGCTYRNISSEDARTCMANRTLACIGDSQIRDLCFAVGRFLSGITVEESPEVKFDKKDREHIPPLAEIIPQQKMWDPTNVKHDYNGMLFPSKKMRNEKGWDWQVQIWELYGNHQIQAKANGSRASHVEDVLNNKMATNVSNSGIRNIDLAFWSHGLHDWGWWNQEPYYLKYFDQMVGQWLRLKDNVAVPSVWVSMNNNCKNKLSATLMGGQGNKQVDMVEVANAHTHSLSKVKKFPYFDAASVLRTPTRCDISDDGLHVKMWVDIVRAKILLNHLCDENNNWVGGIDKFIGSN